MEGTIEEFDTKMRTFELHGIYTKKEEKKVLGFFRKGTKLTINSI